MLQFPDFVVAQARLTRIIFHAYDKHFQLGLSTRQVDEHWPQQQASDLYRFNISR